jgi:hypothetical protein
MTAARHNRKVFTLHSIAALLLALALPALAATTERIVVDWRTGLAIHGFDPVAYFTNRAPLIGRAELEFPFAGAVWRFRNVGNRAAFSERPDVYMPRFGGYDPIAIARGVASPGHPEVWFITGDRLYLFHEVEARSAFVASAEPATAAAEAKWADVERGLAP